MNLSVMSIAVLIVCIVAANLLLVALRTVVDMPWPDRLESALAVGVGVLAWFFIAPRLKR